MMELRTYIAILRRRWLILVAIVALVAFLMMVVVF